METDQPSPWLRMLTWIKDCAKFWKRKKEMPGVNDQIRRTKLAQEQKARQQDMLEILTMVQQGRLHEADVRQLETLKLALDLQKALSQNTEPKEAPALNTDALAEAIKSAIAEAFKDLPAGTYTGTPIAHEDPSRPKMTHVSLTEFVHVDENVVISHGDSLGEDKEGGAGAGDKLDKLRKLKGNG